MDGAEVGRRLAAARILAGLTRAEVAEAALEAGVPGLSRASFSRLEGGRDRVDVTVVDWLCRHYGISIEILMDEDYKAFKNFDGLAEQVGRLTEAVSSLQVPPANRKPVSAKT